MLGFHQKKNDQKKNDTTEDSVDTDELRLSKLQEDEQKRLADLRERMKEGTLAELPKDDTRWAAYKAAEALALESISTANLER